MFSSLSSRLNRPALAALLSLVALLGLCCPPQKTHLEIPDENAAAWMSLNNFFEPPTPTRPHRTGLLLQLGEYKGASFKLDSIELHKQDGTVDQLKSSEGFYWVNVVSASTLTTAPISDDEAFHLFPNCHVSYDTACDAVLHAPEGQRKWCTTTDTACATVQPLKQSCIRGRRLHADLEPASIITYWQGDGGYAVSAKQVDEEHNSFLFTFHDAFRVTVYKLKEDSTCPSLAWDPPTAYTEGDIEKIVVKGVLTAPPLGGPPPTHGGHRDPPW